MSAFDIPRRGTSHHGLVTRDADATIDFYQNKLGFPLIFNSAEPENASGSAGGSHSPKSYNPMIPSFFQIPPGSRHIFFDIGNDQMFTFFELPKWDGDGPDPLEVVQTEVHWAFEAGTDDNLEARRQDLMAKGVPVTDIALVGVEYPSGERVDTAHSIYLRDPVNDILLEFTVFVRNFTEKDLNNKPFFSENHGSPEFMSVFLGPKRWEAFQAHVAAKKAPVHA